ncbi:5'/3'-nucleotidase SurE [Pleionea mediterranea]|uniref:5'-nucleotidase SurE n=1 Tax=Pleionea mediterranea TaxID=523701 RepID=A0A316FBZ1_9GAMM|nr:5'/3'-nucleotidase SurE [Pleionea mediterranea]PWK44416.1 5'-nucleotidase /3'-nucleotidase /exopolyphosphatase [Pleionea mediterranea]
MNILLSNDDGYFAPGLSCLYQYLAKTHEVTVVAPDRNCSGASNSLTLEVPIRVKKTEQGFYSVTGTPTDCVHVGTYHLMSNTPDIVVAGINAGANLGDDVLYSGTVAAAMEGRSLGLPAIAVSLVGKECRHYETAAHAVTRIINRLKDNPLPLDRILNINVPDIAPDKIAGYQLTRLGSRHRADTIVPAKDPKGRTVYWLGPTPGAQDEAEGTDFYAVDNGYVSITPISVDVTAYDCFDQVGEWMSEL